MTQKHSESVVALCNYTSIICVYISEANCIQGNRTETLWGSKHGDLLTIYMCLEWPLLHCLHVSVCDFCLNQVLVWKRAQTLFRSNILNVWIFKCSFPEMSHCMSTGSQARWQCCKDCRPALDIGLFSHRKTRPTKLAGPAAYGACSFSAGGFWGETGGLRFTVRSTPIWPCQYDISCVMSCVSPPPRYVLFSCERKKNKKGTKCVIFFRSSLVIKK